MTGFIPFGHYTLAMVDIDHFKKFNDSYGHAEGDNVLRMVAQHLVSRLGKEFFAMEARNFAWFSKAKNATSGNSHGSRPQNL